MKEEIVEFFLKHTELVLIAFLSLVQIAPIKINPWTAIGKVVEQYITGNLKSAVDLLHRDLSGMTEEVDGLKEDIQNVRDEVDAANARQSRVRILRFDDELLRGEPMTKDHFRQIIEDIDIYEGYCDRHPDFRNGVAKHAMEHIKTVFDEYERNGGFLT